MSSTYTTLISAAELARHIGAKNWVVLDCRHDLTDPEAGRAAFAKAHIPTAQFVHLDQDLAGNQLSADGVFHGRHPLPDKEIFIAKLRAWGINDDTQVVAYDAHGGMFAARCWWMLRWVGHAAVAVLDGGLSAWSAANNPFSQEAFVPEPGAINEKKSLVKSVDVKEVLAHLGSKQMTLVDARSPARFRGEDVTLDKVAGHIPGAKNRFFKDNLKENGYFKLAEELREEFCTVVNNPEQVVMQCGSGITACHNLLAMEIAGMTGAALYAGSWSEWCADPVRPVAVG